MASPTYQQLQDALSVLKQVAVPITSVGYQQLTSEALLSVQTLSVPAGATRAHVQSNGGTGIRWRSDGVAPSANMGMLLDTGEETDIAGNLAAYKFIGVGPSSVLDVTYYA